MPLTLDLDTFIQELKNPGSVRTAEEIIQAPPIRIKDTTPRAVPTNNLTIERAVPSVLNAVIDEAHRQGVDPMEPLAEAWKESGFGTIHRPNLVPHFNTNPDLKWQRVYNPMQYNFQDLAPKVQKDEMHLRRLLSETAWRKIVENALGESPQYMEAYGAYEKERSRRASYDEPGDEERFQKARMNAIGLPIRQNLYVKGGVNYLNQMKKDSCGDLQKGYEKYRGTGQAARYHGRHVMELYKAALRDKILREMIDARRMGA